MTKGEAGIACVRLEEDMAAALSFGESSALITFDTVKHGLLGICTACRMILILEMLA